MAGFQTAFDDYAADCAQSAGCPLGTDPAQFVNRYHQLVDPLVNQPGTDSDPRGLSYQDAITGTVNALYSQRYWQYLTSGLLGLQRGTDAGDLLLLADDYQNRDAVGPLPELCRTRSTRSAASTRRTRPTRRCGPPPTGGSAQAAPFLEYGTFTGFAPRDICAIWPVPATSTPHPAASPGPGQGRRRLHHPRPGHAVSGGRRSGPSDGRLADHVRRHPAHRGVQRRPMCRHGGGELLDRLGGAAGRSALLTLLFAVGVCGFCGRLQPGDDVIGIDLLARPVVRVGVDR